MNKANLPADASEPPQRQTEEFGATLVREGSLDALLGGIVEAAMVVAGADFGNIQLLDDAADLRIVAQRGFPQWWIEYWNRVSAGHGSCGTALERGERVIIENVEQSSIFANSPALEMQLKAGVRAVQSTPLVSRSGKLLGIFSTHYRNPHRPDERALRLLDLFAQQAADIVERTRAEHALHESEQRLRLALEAANLGTWDWDLRTKRLDWSPRCLQIFGLPKNTRMSYERLLQVVHVDDRERINAAVKAALEEREYYDVEMRTIWPDGTLHWVILRGCAYYDESGEPIRMSGAALDITAHKLADARLKADLAALTIMHALSGRALTSQGYQPLLQEIMDVAVEIMGASRGTLQLLEGDSLRIVAHHGHERPFLDFFESAENRASVCGEAMLRGKRVVVQDVENSALFIGTPSLGVLREAGVRAVQSTPLLSRSGVLLGILTTHWPVPYDPDEHDLWRIDLLARQAADLIERAQAQEAQKQAEQALLRSEKLASAGRIAATIAHEINNPLAAVTNSLYLAQMVEHLPESARKYLETADEELRRVAHIARQSLGFYREAKTPAPTSIAAVVDSAVDLMKGRIRAKHAVIQKEWEYDLQVIAVAGELRQVLSNLLANSLDAIEEGGTIRIRVSSANYRPGRRCARVTVADNGKGISASTRQHLFEPFFTTKDAVGTGLGLWVSKQIVEKHGGMVRVRSSNNGTPRGTVISIVLPMETSSTAPT